MSTDSVDRVAVAAWESLFRAQVTVLRDISASFPSEVISLTEYDVLFNLARMTDRQARLKDLTKQLLITQPSVSRLVDRLVARGLVAKCTPEDDGRGTLVKLTADGLALFRAIGARHAVEIARRFEGVFDADELEQLTELCDRLRLGRPAS